MNRYISTLWVSTDPYTSARIIISYYSRTRRKSQRFYDTVTVRVGSSVVQISNVPLVELARTLRVTLTALVLLPYYIAHAARLSPDRERLGFFEKGCDFVEDEDPYAQIEQKIDSVVNGRIYNFNGVSVRSTPPLSYIRTLLPRFSSARNDDSTAIARILCAVHRTPQRIARFGFVDYKQDSVLSLVRTYYQYLKVNSILTDDDKIILHASRCLTRFCNSSSDVDIESYINKLYRLFLYVFKFFRNWHLPSFGSDISTYSNRIRFIIKTGIKYEKKKDYESLRDVFNIRSVNPDISDCMFALPQNGQERDVLSNVSCETVLLLEQLRYRSSTFCRDMIKHKKLNDANNIFNRMV